MHYGLLWNDKGQKGSSLKLPEHVGEDFHVFALKKTRNTISWHVDGHRFLEITDGKKEKIGFCLHLKNYACN